MLKITDKNFLTIIKELDSLTEGERVLFFSEQSPDKFILWWFYYYHEGFITPLADFHYDWIESLISGKDVFIEGFRGSIKTSITLAVVCYFITLKKYRFIVWQSYESTSSTRNTTQIALKLMNKKLERDYGALFSLKGGNEDLEKKSVGEFDTRNGVKVLSASLGEKIRGAISKNTRPELLILDDIDVTDSVKNPDIIQKNYDKITSETFGAMSKTNAKIIFLGNTINQDGVVPRFRQEKKGIWDIYHQPLIVEDVIQWRFFTEDMIQSILDKEGERAYNQNYLLKPIDIYAGGLIKQEDLRYYDHVSLDDFDSVYIHADTTHTGKTTSDYFACGVIGMSNKDKNFYLLDFILEKMDVEKQARSCISLYSKYDTKVKKMTYDEKSNQGFGFWIKKLAKEEYNISLPIQDLKYPNDKVTHFEPHVPHFKANRVFLPKNHNRINVLTDQVLAFPTKGVNDDACFVADTKIFTDSGDKNIQNISIGDYVLTRKGFKRVIALSKRKEYVIDNIGLTGTGNHPIITKNGVNCLANISESDILYTLDYNNIPCIEKPSFTIEGNSIDTLSQSIHTYETIFGVTQRANELLRIYIELCGLTIIEKSLKIIISIIKTATLGIMNYQILRGYIKVTILENIGGQKSEGRNQDKQQRKTIELSSSEGKNGLLPKNEKSFLNESLKKISLWEKKKENAIIVKQNLKQFILNKDSAQKYVVNEGGIQKRNEEKTKSGFKNNEKTSYSSKKKSQGTVRYAELDLAQIIQEKNTVAQNAIISHSKEKEWVYNFEVEGEHEYFANGILVHNCDMISGCLDNYNIKKKKVEFFTI